LNLTNPHSLQALDWGSLRSLLVLRSARERNRAAFASLEPGGKSQPQVERELGEIAAFRLLLDEGALRLEGIPEVDEIRASLSVRGEYVDGPSLSALARFAEMTADLGRDVAARLGRIDLDGSRFGSEAAALSHMADLPFVRSVFEAIGPTGEILDDASPELRRLRARTHRLREDLDQVFESYLHRPNADDVLQDKVVASRNGRSVLMVKAEAKRSFGGVVHGASRSQNTAFVEPIEAVEVNNELVVVSEEEQEEIRQILRRISDQARDDLDALDRADRVLESWDALHAKARLARDLDARVPVFSNDGELRIVRGIHPLLVDRVRADLDLPITGREAVPLDLEMTDARRILVIGGPNTGGKTVALKTVGLLSLMARSGLLIPTGEASRCRSSTPSSPRSVTSNLSARVCRPSPRRFRASRGWTSRPPAAP